MGTKEYICLGCYHKFTGCGIVICCPNCGRTEKEVEQLIKKRDEQKEAEVHG